MMFEILDEICTPKRGTKYSAYVDLFSREDIVIGAGETKIVKLGVKLDIDELYNLMGKIGYFGGNCRIEAQPEFEDNCNVLFDDFLKSHYLEVALRSSLGVKGLIIANGIGIIDLDYRDEIGLIVHNPINYDQMEFVACQEANYDGGDRRIPNDYEFKISKGDKVAQCTLKEHKGWLMGYESDNVRIGGFGSTGK